MTHAQRVITILTAVIAGLMVIAIGWLIVSSGTKKSTDAESARSKTPVEEKLEEIAPVMQKDTMTQSSEKITAVMKTNFGDITFELFSKDAPNTVANFVKLSESGFYDGVKFHRVIRGFMIQGGDPNSKDDDWSNDGIGGPGYTFADEINPNKVTRGALAMANAGPDTNGSQFFIVTTEAAPWLDGKHTVFGRVTAGMDVVASIENTPTDKTQGDHPLKDVVISSITITK